MILGLPNRLNSEKLLFLLDNHTNEKKEFNRRKKIKYHGIFDLINIIILLRLINKIIN